MSRDLAALTSSAADWSGLRATVAGIGVAGFAAADALLDLGAEVTVIEFLDRITPGIDLEIAKTLQRTLAKQGLKFRLGTKVTSATASWAIRPKFRSA